MLWQGAGIQPNANLLQRNANPLIFAQSVKKPTMSASPLHSPSSPAWLECVLNHFDQFLLDHAAAEKKAAGMALSMLSHYPDRTRLVTAMSELAVEEMVHFREVVKLIQERQLQLGADEKDPYVNEIRSWIRQGSDV